MDDQWIRQTNQELCNSTETRNRFLNNINTDMFKEHLGTSFAVLQQVLTLFFNNVNSFPNDAVNSLVVMEQFNASFTIDSIIIHTINY